MATPPSRPLERTRHPGIYRRGGGYVYRYRDPSDRMRQASARTLAEARRRRADRESEVRRGEWTPASRLTFTEYAPRWLAGYRGTTARGVRPETLAEYGRDLQRAVERFGPMRLTAIGPADMRGFAAELARGGQGPRSTRRIIGVFRLALAGAVEDGLLRTNPASGIRLGGIVAHQAEPEEPAARVLTPAEVGRLIAAAPEGWERLLVRLIASTGLRISEALGLRWSDLDVSGRTVSVAGRVRATRRGPVKSAAGLRTIPIGAELARALAAHRLASLHSGDADYFFAAEDGRARGQTKTYSWLRAALERAGIPWPGGWHGLRRSCASAWLASGVPLAVVARLLGHTPAVCLQAYVHARATDTPSGELLASVVGAG